MTLVVQISLRIFENTHVFVFAIKIFEIARNPLKTPLSYPHCGCGIRDHARGLQAHAALVGRSPRTVREAQRVRGEAGAGLVASGGEGKRSARILCNGESKTQITQTTGSLNFTLQFTS